MLSTVKECRDSIGTVTSLVELNKARTMLDIVVIDNPNATFNLLELDWCHIFSVQILMGSKQLILDLGGGEQFKVTYDSRLRSRTQSDANMMEIIVPRLESNQDKEEGDESHGLTRVAMKAVWMMICLTSRM